jgi:hypothetical protein
MNTGIPLLWNRITFSDRFGAATIERIIFSNIEFFVRNAFSVVVIQQNSHSFYEIV